MNEGLYEYEHLLNDRRYYAVTLIRSVGMISNLPDRHQRNTMKNIDSQCIGKYTLHLGLTFAKGEADMQVSELVRRTKISKTDLSDISSLIRKRNSQAADLRFRTQILQNYSSERIDIKTLV